MKTQTIHVARVRMPSIHTYAIHLASRKSIGKDITIDILSDGRNILTDGRGYYLTIGKDITIDILSDGRNILTDERGYYLTKK